MGYQPVHMMYTRSLGIDTRKDSLELDRNHIYHHNRFLHKSNIGDHISIARCDCTRNLFRMASVCQLLGAGLGLRGGDHRTVTSVFPESQSAIILNRQPHFLQL